MVTRAFTGRQSGLDHSDRIPSGQHLVDDLPVLTAGPTPRIAVEDWRFTLKVGPPGYVLVCGSNAFVDVAADGALMAGLDAASIKTERYGG